MLLLEFRLCQLTRKADKDTKEKVCGLNDRETTIENPLDEIWKRKRQM